MHGGVCNHGGPSHGVSRAGMCVCRCECVSVCMCVCVCVIIAFAKPRGLDPRRISSLVPSQALPRMESARVRAELLVRQPRGRRAIQRSKQDLIGAEARSLECIDNLTCPSQLHSHHNPLVHLSLAITSRSLCCHTVFVLLAWKRRRRRFICIQRYYRGTQGACGQAL